MSKIMVGRRGEAPQVPPYILCNFKLDGAVAIPSLVDATLDREHLRGVANGQADNLRRLTVTGSFRIATLAGIGVFDHRTLFILMA